MHGFPESESDYILCKRFLRSPAFANEKVGSYVSGNSGHSVVMFASLCGKTRFFTDIRKM